MVILKKDDRGKRNEHWLMEMVVKRISVVKVQFNGNFIRCFATLTTLHSTTYHLDFGQFKRKETIHFE